METFLRWLHRYVSPVFLVMLVASFILWYIAKLSYTYTTEYVVSINTDGEKYKVACIFEGVGTNLVSYHTSLGKSVKIPLSELKYKKSREEGHEGMLIIDPPVPATRHRGSLQRCEGLLDRGRARNTRPRES